MGEEPESIFAVGSCHVDFELLTAPVKEPSERFDTAAIIVQYPHGRQAIIDVCRQAPYGYDQRAEILGSKGMLQSENVFSNTVYSHSATYSGHLDLPLNFFMERYETAYRNEAIAFIDSIVNDVPPLVSGRDGVAALAMALAAGKSAQEKRWVDMSEVLDQSAMQLIHGK